MMTRWRSFSGILFPILLLCLSSCEQTQSNNKEAEEVELRESGYLRGFRPGMTPEEVEKMESWRPLTSTDTLITYQERVITEGHEADLRLYLAFDSYGLFEVQADCFPADSNGVVEVFEKWRESLTEAFGESEEVFTATRWTTFSKNNHIVEVTLSLESDNEEGKFISLNYLEPLDDTY